MAFRTRCPQCGTLFSAPDEMIERELKCPRCKESFIAREEVASPSPRPPQQPPGGPETQRPPGTTGAPLPSESAAGPESREGAGRIQHYCPVCNAAFTEEDILDGLAVRRFDEVYCRKHFKQQFPDECEQHPGTKAVTQCGRCGQPLCQNCVVEVQDERLCSRCKRVVLGELRGDLPPGGAFAFGDRPGLPWDTEEGSFMGRLFGTVKEVLFSPGQAFQKMHLSGGYGKPLLYAFLLVAVFTCIAYFWQFVLMGAMMGAMGPSPGFGQSDMAAAGAASLIGSLFGAIIGALIGPFIQAAIFHVSLLILKGANSGYEGTYRVVAYTSGSTAVWYVIPIAGQFIGGIWAIVATIIGFSRANNISGGKAALAFFLPVIVCCGMYAAFVGLIFASMGGM